MVLPCPCRPLAGVWGLHAVTAWFLFLGQHKLGGGRGEDAGSDPGLDGDAKASSMPGCSLMGPVGRSAQLCSGPVMPSVEVKLDLIHLVLTVWSAPFLCMWVNGVASDDALPCRQVCIYRVNMDGLNFLFPVLLIDTFHQAQQTPSLHLLYPGNLVTLETSILFPETFMVFCLVTL